MRATQRYDFETKQWVEIEYDDAPRLHYVMPDIEDFQSPDGARISGRSQWREHLERTDSIELGQADIRKGQENWQKKKDDFQQRLNRPGAKPVDPPSGEIQEYQRSRVNAEIANRLDGRPAPERKRLIQMVVEEARRMRGRG